MSRTFDYVPNYNLYSYALYEQNALVSIAEYRLSGLHNLKVLDLSRNSLTALPNDLCKLPLLETLMIHRNKLVIIHLSMCDYVFG